MIDPSHPKFESVLDLLLDAVCMVDANGHFVYVSAAGEAIFGYRPEEMVGRRMMDLVHPDDHDRTRNAAGQVMAGQIHLHFENRYIRKDGTVAHIMWTARWSPHDQLRVGVARDITARKRAERLQAATYAISEAAQSSDSLNDLFPQIHQALHNLLPSPSLLIALRDPHSGVLSFPYAVEAGRVPAPPDGTALEAFSAEVLSREETLLLDREAMAAGEATRRLLEDPQLQWVLGMPLRTEQQTSGAMVLKSHTGGAPYSAQDLDLLQYVSTQIATALHRKQLFARMQRMAQYDSLTELPNRGLLHDRLATAINRARRDKRQFSLLFLDLDKFKRINDTLGHALGDRLLHAFAMRLKQCVRESDTVARVGGDEFVVVLESSLQPESNHALIHKIRGAFSDPFRLDAHTIFVRPSIGVAHYPEHGAQAQALLSYADSAMFMAKAGRRGAGPND